VYLEHLADEFDELSNKIVNSEYDKILEKPKTVDAGTAMEW